MNRHVRRTRHGQHPAVHQNDNSGSKGSRERDEEMASVGESELNGADDNFELVQVRRRKAFQRLIRWYFVQLRYGCQRPDCQVPTCFSCQRRIASINGTPLRRPTPLTARAQAYFFASQENAESRLCPHAIQQTREVYGEHNSADEAGIGKSQGKKDPKSLSQNLFDTTVVGLFESMNIADPSENIADKQARDGLCDLDDGSRTLRSNSIGTIARSPSFDSIAEAISSLRKPDSPASADNQSSSPILDFDHDTAMIGRVADPEQCEKKESMGDRTGERSEPRRLSTLIPVRESRLQVNTGNGESVFVGYLSSRKLERLKQIAGMNKLHYDDGPKMASRRYQTSSSHASRIDKFLFRNLSTADSLIISFRGDNPSKGPETISDSFRLEAAFRDWRAINGSLIYDSLWFGIEPLFNPPVDINPPRSPGLKTPRQGIISRNAVSLVEDQNLSKRPHYVDDADAAHIVMLCTLALSSLAMTPINAVLTESSHPKPAGKLYNSPISDANMSPSDRDLLDQCDGLEYEPGLRLVRRMIRAVAARRCFCEIRRATAGDSKTDTTPPSFIQILLQNLVRTGKIGRPNHENLIPMTGLAPPVTDIVQDVANSAVVPSPSANSIILGLLEWLKTTILREWDGKAEVKRWGAVGGAIELIADLHEHREELGLQEDAFYMKFLSDRLDTIATPTEFLHRPKSCNSTHLLRFPFLFDPSVLVTYFRSVNFTRMSKSYESSGYTAHLMERFPFITGPPHQAYLTRRLKSALSRYLVLDVRRENILEDAFNQLWQREKRELMRPLKVRMGAEEGEEGVDHGGVSQEFFRIALGEALAPDAGLFTMDTRTRMTWFRPTSFEPLFRFELIGLLVSLAIYNGVTLPFTFPKALYRRLLGLPVTFIDHIRDGWPELARGLEAMISWEDGDVSDTFTRTYVFSFENAGRTVDIDMEASNEDESWQNAVTNAGSTPYQNGKLSGTQALGSHGAGSVHGATEQSTKSGHNDLVHEPKLVTNQNRSRYVRDYILWLTDKSIRPQYEAFARGFYKCLDKTSLSILTPDILRDITEGFQIIDIGELASIARYEDGYSSSHRTIIDFWSIVNGYSLEQKRQLLEFVTASDRVPVNGIKSIAFCIIRNGGDTERIPTAMTCFGKLLLPEYETSEKLRRKLDIALDNSRGFGTL